MFELSNTFFSPPRGVGYLEVLACGIKKFIADCCLHDLRKAVNSFLIVQWGGGCSWWPLVISTSDNKSKVCGDIFVSTSVWNGNFWVIQPMLSLWVLLANPFGTAVGSDGVSLDEAQQQLMDEVPEECMHRHALPLCTEHLALFQCHRVIYISKGDDQEGSLCAPFLTPEMIWFISSSTEIYAPAERHRASLVPRKERWENLWSCVWSQTPCHSAWFMWCGLVFLCSRAHCV